MGIQGGRKPKTKLGKKLAEGKGEVSEGGKDPDLEPEPRNVEPEPRKTVVDTQTEARDQQQEEEQEEEEERSGDELSEIGSIHSDISKNGKRGKGRKDGKGKGGDKGKGAKKPRAKPLLLDGDMESKLVEEMRALPAIWKCGSNEYKNTELHSVAFDKVATSMTHWHDPPGGVHMVHLHEDSIWQSNQV